MPMNKIQEHIYEQYIQPGKTVPQIDETLSGVNLNSLWNYLKEMLAGRMSSEEVLEQWDSDFKEQMSYMENAGQ